MEQCFVYLHQVIFVYHFSKHNRQFSVFKSMKRVYCWKILFLYCCMKSESNTIPVAPLYIPIWVANTGKACIGKLSEFIGILTPNRRYAYVFWIWIWVLQTCPAGGVLTFFSQIRLSVCVPNLLFSWLCSIWGSKSSKKWNVSMRTILLCKIFCGCNKVRFK